MKYLKFLSISIFIFFSSLVSIKTINLVKSFRTDNHKNKIINDYRKKLKSCFDLENKQTRKIHESLKLIEYCVKEFGLE